MSNLNYRQKLNIPSISISHTKKLIKDNIRIILNMRNKNNNIKINNTYHIIGPAGIGKTAICKQICNEISNELGISFNLISFICPWYTKEDFMIPFPNIENKTFESYLSEMIPRDKNSYGLIVLDEFSRAEKQVQQLLWQLIYDNKMNNVKLPDGWFVISLDNPDDSEYDMEYCDDAAGIRRACHLYMDVNVNDFLTYAISKNFHEIIIGFIQTYPELLYDFESQKIGRIYANPASYEKISDIFYMYENDNQNIKDIINNIEPLISGYLNSNVTSLLIDYINKINIIDPKDIIYNYNKIEKDIKNIIINKDNAKISKLTTGLVTYLCTSRPNDLNKKELGNIAYYLNSIPIDCGVILITSLKDMDRSTPEFIYMSQLNSKLMIFDEYKKYHENIVKISRKN